MTTQCAVLTAFSIPSLSLPHSTIMGCNQSRVKSSLSGNNTNCKNCTDCRNCTDCTGMFPHAFARRTIPLDLSRAAQLWMHSMLNGARTGYLPELRRLRWPQSVSVLRDLSRFDDVSVLSYSLSGHISRFVCSVTSPVSHTLSCSIPTNCQPSLLASTD